MRRMDTHSLSDLVDLCEVEGKSPRTVRAYRWTLDRFTDALHQDGAPGQAHDITREHVYGYLGRFTQLSADTRHRYFREVRCFFNWLVNTGYLEQTPFRGVKNIRLPQRIVRPFSRDEVVQLLASCGEGPIGIRDRALMMTLLDTGMRCSEVTQLELSDLDRASGRIRVRFGKGSKQRLRGQLRDRLEAAMTGVDVPAMPTCKVTAPPRPDADDYLLVLSENCIPWSLVDFPAISVPMGLADGMPCGIQFVAAPGQDPLLVSMAYAYERVAPAPLEWSER